MLYNDNDFEDVSKVELFIEGASMSGFMVSLLLCNTRLNSSISLFFCLFKLWVENVTSLSVKAQQLSRS